MNEKPRGISFPGAFPLVDGDFGTQYVSQLLINVKKHS